MNDPRELAAHLAVLDVVEHALGVAVRALVADFPTLLGEPHPRHREEPDERAARRLLHRMLHFERVIARYRAALPAPSADDRDDLDF